VTKEPHPSREYKDNTPPRVIGVDSVRALAALSVACAHIVGPALPGILQHTPLGETHAVEYSKYLFTGHPAVIAFFVVSGFCIHYPYTRKALPVIPFWAARLVRIMIPALVAIIFAKIARLKFYNFWDGYILWSIVCELFYYMLYPVFLFATKWLTWRSQFYFALSLSFALGIGIGSDEYGNPHVYGLFLNWIICLPSWLAGCVLAEQVYAERETTRASSQAEVILWRLVVAGIASWLFWSSMNTSFGFYLTLNGFALLVFLWIRAEIHLQDRRQDTVLERAGRWSYSMYLVHMPAFAILGRLFTPLWNEFAQVFAFPFILYVCFLFYRKVELPAHNYARYLFRKIDPHEILVPQGGPPGGASARSTTSDIGS
jgi:peptidoglycan/LPS O-acetylase OafA/YrhL